MGPFFLLGAWLDLPGWVVQRLWLALVLCVAFAGAAKVARALGVRSDLACLLAGFAYALSPRMLTTLGPISIEAWPSALAPWVLLPLVIGAQRGSPRRAAALVGAGGRHGRRGQRGGHVRGPPARARCGCSPGRPVRGAVRCWSGGRCSRCWARCGGWSRCSCWAPTARRSSTSSSRPPSPPSRPPSSTPCGARRTGSRTSTLRSRAGNDLIRQSYLVLNSGVVLLLGLVGLLRRRNPHRLFLGLGV